MGRSRTANRRRLVLGAAAIAIVMLLGLGALEAAGRLVERTETVTVPVDTGPGGTADARARCPRGKQVVLGGFAVPLNVEDVSNTHLKLGGKRAWRAAAVNYDADEPTTLTSVAYCARLKGIETRERTVTIPEQGPGDRPVTVVAECHPGERLAFGGFDYDQGARPGLISDAYLSELRRTGKRGWRVGAFNYAGSAPLTAIAYCSEQAPKTTLVEEKVTVGPSGRGRVKARCDRGERVAFGGYKADVDFDTGLLLHGLRRTSARAWQVTARNGSTPADLTAYAYCAER